MLSSGCIFAERQAAEREAVETDTSTDFPSTGFAIMTGYTVHTGSSEQFSDGWERIFSGKKAGKKASGKKVGSKVSGKKKTSTGRKSQKKK